MGELPEIKGGNHGLSRAGSRDHEMTVCSQYPFVVQGIQDFLLERMGVDIHKGEELVVSNLSLSFQLEHFLQFGKALAGEVFKFRILPVPVESVGHFGPEIRQFKLADFGGPFQPLGKR